MVNAVLTATARLAALLVGLLYLAGGAVHAQDSNRRDGSLERVMVHGTSLEGALAGYPADRQVTIYLPPGYASDPARRYPVIFALHGFGGSGADWPGFLGAPDAFDRAIAAGAAPMIVVMPDAMTQLGGAMFSNSVTTGDWEGFVADDLVAWVDAHYRTLPVRDSRGIAGFSVGGYGALRLAMKRPDVFSSLYAMSSCCLPPQVPPVPAEGSLAGFAALEAIRTPEDAAKLGFGAAPLAMAAAWSPNPARPPFFFDLPTKDGVPQPDIIAAWSANALLVMIHQYVPALRRLKGIALDVGAQDYLLADNQRLHELLDRYRIRHTFAMYEGGHGDRIAERFEQQVWPHFSATLAGASR